MQRPDSLGESRIRVLEQVVTGEALPSTQARLCREAEAVVPTQRCGVRLADRHTVGSSEGTRLGLHLCRKPIQAHGGDITLESRVGEGMTVVCLIPADRAVVT